LLTAFLAIEVERDGKRWRGREGKREGGILSQRLLQRRAPPPEVNQLEK
jgi:hypothetical protein